MNPFDLRGPEFLFFYVVFVAAVLTVVYVLRRMREGGRPPKMELNPYAIAYLRGGEAEAVRVAIVSLVDRGLLEVDGSKLKRAARADADAVRHRLEKLLLDQFDSAREAPEVFKSRQVSLACSEYRSTLETHALLPDGGARSIRALLFTGSLFLLVAAAILKVGIALDRGRSNVGFLIFLMMIAIIPAWKVCYPRQTVRGKAMLADLRELFASLRRRAETIQPGGATIEAVMLAAVFGIVALPEAGFGYTRKLFPQAAKDTGSSSSCGASCGSSCGSSCGGGGGGCGGCGS